MREVEPTVFFVGETKCEPNGVHSFLMEVGAPEWRSDGAQSDAEGLIELYGRGCYRSFAPGLNANVSKVRAGHQDYIDNILAQGHGSVLEHSTANFVFMHVSRVFTHELVRHRVGTAISQESLRFVRLDELDFWIPEEIKQNEAALAVFKEAIAVAEQAQKDLAAIFKLDEPGVSFEYKKKITSAMRRIAPEGLATMIGWTANFRTLRHVIELRTDPSAEREIRLVFGKVAEIAIMRWPAVFGDYQVQYVDGLPWYSAMHGGV